MSLPEWMNRIQQQGVPPEQLARVIASYVGSQVNDEVVQAMRAHLGVGLVLHGGELNAVPSLLWTLAEAIISTAMSSAQQQYPADPEARKVAALTQAAMAIACVHDGLQRVLAGEGRLSVVPTAPAGHA